MNKIFIFFLLIINFNLLAKTGSVTGLDIPRFVSLKSNDVNMRVGPSVNYPIKIKYIQKNIPVEIIKEFDVWRQVKDFKNNIGWLHKSLIQGDRYVLINLDQKEIDIFSRPNGYKIGLIKKNNILKLKKCLISWCYINNSNLSGWINKEEIWGVYKKEIYNRSFYQPLVNQYWKLLDGRFFN